MCEILSENRRAWNEAKVKEVLSLTSALGADQTLLSWVCKRILFGGLGQKMGYFM